MILFQLIGILIFIIGCRNFRKGFLMLMVYKAVLNSNVTFISIPGIPLLTVDMFLSIAFVLLFLYKRKRLQVDTVAFPYKKPFIGLFVVATVSFLFGLAPLKESLSAYVGEIFTQIFFIPLIWYVVTTRYESDFILKGLNIVFLIAVVYALYCFATNSNPLIDWEASFIGDNERAHMASYLDEDAGRGARVSSIFYHPIGAGMNFGIYFILVVVLYVVYHYRLPHHTILLMVGIASLIGVVLSNSRGPIVFFIVGSLGLLNMSNKRSRYVIIIAIVAFLIAMPYLGQFFQNLSSIFNSNVQQKVGGSNLEMRLEQLAACWEVMSINPFTGVGYKAEYYVNPILYAQLLGLESVWFWVITKNGLLGIVVNLFFAWWCIGKVPHQYRSYPLFFVSSAYWLVYSVTSLPAFLPHLYYFLLFMIIKQTEVYKGMVK